MRCWISIILLIYLFECNLRLNVEHSTIRIEYSNIGYSTVWISEKSRIFGPRKSEYEYFFEYGYSKITVFEKNNRYTLIYGKNYFFVDVQTFFLGSKMVAKMRKITKTDIPPKLSELQWRFLPILTTILELEVNFWVTTICKCLKVLKMNSEKNLKISENSWKNSWKMKIAEIAEGAHVAYKSSSWGGWPIGAKDNYVEVVDIGATPFHRQTCMDLGRCKLETGWGYS